MAARQESARRVSDCVTALLRDQPFFGSLALRLPIRPDPARETLASDGREIRYSPDWIANTDADFIKTAIGRVVLACALKHHTRRGMREPGRWQQASQLVTHGLLRDAGFKLPPEAEAWDGISVEQAYDRLPEPQDDDGHGGAEDGPPPSPGAGSDGSDDPQDGGADHDDQSGGDTDASGDADPQNGDDTGEDDGTGEAPSVDPAGTGEIMDAAARNGADPGTADASMDVNAEEQAWDEAMHQALNLAKAQGKAPGAVEETVRDAHRSTLDWRSLLRRYMTDAAARDYSWSVPNRRFIDSGLYLPSIRSEGMGALAVIIDTSGSVDSDALAAFWSEIREVAAEIEPDRIVVLQVDAAVQDEEHYVPGELPERIVVKGRWGTDFRPGFERLAEQGIRPAVCLYFTDMDCDRYPETEPDFDVLWCDYGSAAGLSPEPPPWGEHIRIDA
ncbi:MAG: VWA-like domain-containing protein [Rhodospirillales bacterium]|nr:VWA-like domain-containing protein [Rhodospirillales bacterium]